jgi:hypothetical protein
MDNPTLKVKELQERYKFNLREGIAVNDLLSGSVISFDICDGLIYFVDQANLNVKLFHLETMTPAGDFQYHGEKPFGMYVDSGKRLYVCDRGLKCILAYSLETYGLLKQIPFQGDGFTPATIDLKLGETLYGTAWDTVEGGAIWTLENDTPRVIYKKDTDFSPRVLITKDNKLYIGNYKEKRFDILSIDGRLIQPGANLDEMGEGMIFTKLSDGELIGINTGSTVVKFSFDGRLIFFKQLHMAEPWLSPGYQFCKFHKGLFYVLDIRSGIIHVFEV